MKTPPASFLLKKAGNIKSGSSKPSKEFAGTVNRTQLEEIARIKNPDLTAADMNAAVATIIGTANSMGLKITQHHGHLYPATHKECFLSQLLSAPLFWG